MNLNNFFASNIISFIAPFLAIFSNKSHFHHHLLPSIQFVCKLCLAHSNASAYRFTIYFMVFFVLSYLRHFNFFHFYGFFASTTAAVIVVAAREILNFFLLFPFLLYWNLCARCLQINTFTYASLLLIR